ncbi:MAG: hypothetical protein M3442_12130, partial [Chloroflexota bacterium]|nr:hypothetical protein [Chloroflexota bacterium]
MTQPSATSRIIVDQADPLTASPPVVWAVEQLRAALAGNGAEGGRPADGRVRVETGEVTPVGPPAIVVAGSLSPVAQSLLDAAGVSLPHTPEAFALVPGVMTPARPPGRADEEPPGRAVARPDAPGTGTQENPGRAVLLACGADPRGLVYALLELAERIEGAHDPARVLQALFLIAPLVERPANEIRGLMRLFTSDVEDLGWYHDRDFWRRYLTMLTAQRYNRFHLALGIGFDFARRMRDSYFYFPYPFLVAVPGYSVRASGVSDAERDRNLDTLRFIATETRRRGLHFQLGVWANVYEFEDSPDVNHTIEGLDPENHASYCRDALRTILQAVPEIDGVTLRIHGESGIPEGSYAFWETLFDGVAGCGRRVEMDLHAKGIDQRMIDLALDTRQPVVVSPKFWAEHMGLPYHQAEIRALERPGPATGTHARLMALSIGERRFTRYGYADLLAENRPYGVLFRIWPGTHRLLLWGDPVTGRSYGRAFSFCGARGVELFEPLSFSGRRGSGLPDGRDPYQDASLRPAGRHGEWEKYRYTYRLWGRLLYNPDADPETWRRDLRAEFGPGALAAEAALSSASRILPLVTTAHHPSAANNNYWPEIYTNMPIVEEAGTLT